MGAGAGAAALGLVQNWTGFSLCVAATAVALTQLIRIVLRKKVSSGGAGDGHGKRRW